MLSTQKLIKALIYLYGEYSRDDRDSDSAVPAVLNEFEELCGLEYHLCDDKVCSSSDFFLKVTEGLFVGYVFVLHFGR